MAMTIGLSVVDAADVGTVTAEVAIAKIAVSRTKAVPKITAEPVMNGQPAVIAVQTTIVTNAMIVMKRKADSPGVDAGVPSVIPNEIRIVKGQGEDLVEAVTLRPKMLKWMRK